jgi:hypothetical protein
VGVRAGVTLAAVVVAVLASSSSATSSRVQTSTCGARVHQEPNPLLGTLGRSRWVAGTPRTSGLIGVLFGGEVVNGRLAVYAGGVNPGTRGNEKILWIVSRRKRAGSHLAISGRKDGATAVTYRRRFGVTGSPQVPGYNYPSILDLPVPGCWKLTLRTGKVTATVIVLAQAAH